MAGTPARYARVEAKRGYATLLSDYIRHYMQRIKGREIDALHASDLPKSTSYTSRRPPLIAASRVKSSLPPAATIGKWTQHVLTCTCGIFGICDCRWTEGKRMLHCQFSSLNMFLFLCITKQITGASNWCCLNCCHAQLQLRRAPLLPSATVPTKTDDILNSDDVKGNCCQSATAPTPGQLLPSATAAERV